MPRHGWHALCYLVAMNGQETRRTIAVTVWGQRVSPVFDAAGTMLIAEIEGGALIGSTSLAFDPQRPQELLRVLRERRVTCLICGAISEEPAALFEAADLELIPFVAGNVQRVLETVLCGEVLGGELRMPGCGKHICCRGRIRRECKSAATNPARPGACQSRRAGASGKENVTKEPLEAASVAAIGKARSPI